MKSMAALSAAVRIYCAGAEDIDSFVSVGKSSQVQGSGCEAAEILTSQFVFGARQALETARQHDIKIAVLTDGSPSCGSTYVYDGSFQGSSFGDRQVSRRLF